MEEVTFNGRKITVMYEEGGKKMELFLHGDDDKVVSLANIFLDYCGRGYIYLDVFKTRIQYRRMGYGRTLFEFFMTYMREKYPHSPIKLWAKSYNPPEDDGYTRKNRITENEKKTILPQDLLEEFYKSYGFQVYETNGKSSMMVKV